MPKSRRRYGSRNDNVVEAEAVVWAEGNMGGAAIARRIAQPDDWQGTLSLCKAAVIKVVSIPWSVASNAVPQSGGISHAVAGRVSYGLTPRARTTKTPK